MKRIAIPVLVAIFALSIAGCGSNEQVAEKTADTANQVAGTAAKTLTAAKQIAEGEGVACEVGCAGCIYHMEGVEGCTPAIKMADGEPMMLHGVPVDAHALGLCKAARGATVMGEVQDGAFVASAVELD